MQSMQSNRLQTLHRTNSARATIQKSKKESTTATSSWSMFLKLYFQHYYSDRSPSFNLYFNIPYTPIAAIESTMVSIIRSEERRVGKECRSSWSGYQLI